MFASQRFLARLAKLRKSHREAPLDEQVDLVRSAFLGMLSGLPEQMPQEIYELIAERLVERRGQENYLDTARYLADIADLFALQYDERNDPIHPDDWRLLGEIVNDYALDLDMPTLTYVMRLVVDHHGV